MREYALTPVTTSPTTGKKLQFLRVRESSMKGGIAVENKAGFIEVDPLQAKNVLASVESGKIILEFGSQNRQTRLFDVQAILTPEYEAEIDAADNAAAAPATGQGAVIEHK